MSARASLAVLLLAVGSAAARSPGPLACLSDARAEEKACVERARVQCRATFDQKLGTCFGPNADCARDCQGKRSACQAAPDAATAACRKTS